MPLLSTYCVHKGQPFSPAGSITSLENYFREKSGSPQKGQKVISISSPAAADLSLMKLKCQFSQGEMGGINPSSNPSPFSNVGGMNL